MINYVSPAPSQREGFCSPVDGVADWLRDLKTSLVL